VPSGDPETGRQPGPAVESDLPELLRAVRNGCPNATRILFERHAESMRSAIRRFLLPSGHPLRRQIDSVDLLQEGWEFVFRRLREGMVFETERDLMRFLLTVTRNRLREHFRAWVSSKKRCVRLEISLDLSKHDQADPHPSASEQAAAADECDHFVATLPELQRQIVLGLVDGRGLRELAAGFGISVRSAERIAAEARKRWGRRQAELDQY
jgi:RNA polymerase sigma factor (sigma-70 family)